MRVVGITYPHPILTLEVNTHDLRIILDALVFHGAQNEGKPHGQDSDRVASLVSRALERNDR